MSEHIVQEFPVHTREMAALFGIDPEELDAAEAAYEALEPWEREIHDELQRKIDRAVIFGIAA